jgi:hypothetical protein
VTLLVTANVSQPVRHVRSTLKVKCEHPVHHLSSNTWIKLVYVGFNKRKISQVLAGVIYRRPAFLGIQVVWNFDSAEQFTDAVMNFCEPPNGLLNLTIFLVNPHSVASWLNEPPYSRPFNF